MTDDYFRGVAQWSPDGTRLAYWRGKSWTGEGQIMEWAVESRIERATHGVRRDRIGMGLVMDGKDLLVSQEGSETHRIEVWLLPIPAVPHADATARKIISDPLYDVYQSHISPDGRWIVFNASRSAPRAAESKLFVDTRNGRALDPDYEGKYWTINLAGLPMARRFTSFRPWGLF